MGLLPMAAIAHKYFPNGLLFKYAVYLCLHNLACNKCRLMRTHMRTSTSAAHLWLPGGSGYFPPDLLIFSRDDQAVPVHVEEIEDNTVGPPETDLNIIFSSPADLSKTGRIILFEHVSLGLVIDIATSHSPLCNPERGLPNGTLLLQ